MKNSEEFYWGYLPILHRIFLVFPLLVWLWPCAIHVKSSSDIIGRTISGLWSRHTLSVRDWLWRPNINCFKFSIIFAHVWKIELHRHYYGRSWRGGEETLVFAEGTSKPNIITFTLGLCRLPPFALCCIPCSVFSSCLRFSQLPKLWYLIIKLQCIWKNRSHCSC